MNALVAIPAYNESENLPRMISAINNLPFQQPWSILIIDDNSPDGTGPLVEALRAQHRNLFVLHRPEKQGLGQAYTAGFQWGLEKHYDWIVQMDADFSHHPRHLLEMEKHMTAGTYDLVIGSRYIPQGAIRHWGLVRRAMSWLGNHYAGWFLKCPIHDLTGGFNAWSARALQRISFEVTLSRGNAFLIELKYKAFCAGFRFHEFPILFEDREAGQSKMTLGIALEALRNVLKMKGGTP